MKRILVLVSEAVQQLTHLILTSVIHNITQVLSSTERLQHMVQQYDENSLKPFCSCDLLALTYLMFE